MADDLYPTSESVSPGRLRTEQGGQDGVLSALDNAVGWLNTSPLSASDLRGKVVLVDFWTYTCVNWLRTLPYVRAWASKYAEHGLTVIGVHTPEFPFEQDIDNVRRAVRDMRVDYPVAIDSNYGIWDGFGNQYWPALYFIDADGHLRHTYFGEGEYAQSERTIQRLLTESGARGFDESVVTVDAQGVEVAADWETLGSAETYLGADQTTNFASRGGLSSDSGRGYEAPTALSLNHWALSGEWAVGERASVLRAPHGDIGYQFHARDVNIVLAPSAPGTTERFRVRLDGRPPGIAHGADVDDEGNGTVTEPRLYQLIRQPAPITERRFDIEFLDAGVEAFVFTFG
jgi:thiol-disulfide isomerase/thioredoxin